jgi:hypothetical protein
VIKACVCIFGAALESESEVGVGVGVDVDSALGCGIVLSSHPSPLKPET